jgi:hypothetical protein
MMFRIRGKSRYSQSSNDKHGGNTNLLLPVQLEFTDVPHRDAQHPKVQDDTDSRICPADGCNVETRQLADCHSFGFGRHTIFLHARHPS